MAFFGKRDGDEENAGLNNAQTLADIARGIQHCVNSTQEMMEQQYLRLLNRHFDENKQARVVRVKTPNGYELEVPTITLLNPKEMVMEEMLVEMSIRVDQVQAKEVNPEDEACELTRSSFTVSLAPKQTENRASNVIDIMMRFKAGDAPEGVARVVDEFAKQIVPKYPPVGETVE